MAKIDLPKGSGKRLKVREKSMKNQRILKWILSGNPGLNHFACFQSYRVKFLSTRNFLHAILSSADFFSKSSFLKNSFRNTISVKQFGTRSGPTFSRA